MNLDWVEILLENSFKKLQFYQEIKSDFNMKWERLKKNEFLFFNLKYLYQNFDCNYNIGNLLVNVCIGMYIWMIGMFSCVFVAKWFFFFLIDMLYILKNETVYSVWSRKTIQSQHTQLELKSTRYLLLFIYFFFFCLKFSFLSKFHLNSFKDFCFRFLNFNCLLCSQL